MNPEFSPKYEVSSKSFENETVFTKWEKYNEWNVNFFKIWSVLSESHEWSWIHQENSEYWMKI